MEKTPSIYFTILLSFILIVPFALMVFARSEPYPAIILPGGFGITDIRENIITHKDYEIVVHSKSSVNKIKTKELFGRIPKPYHMNIIKSNFKFREGSNNELRKFYEKNMDMTIDSIEGFFVEIKKERGAKSEISREIKERYSIKF